MQIFNRSAPNLKSSFKDISFVILIPKLLSFICAAQWEAIITAQSIPIGKIRFQPPDREANAYKMILDSCQPVQNMLK